MKTTSLNKYIVTVLVAAGLLWPIWAHAHCDTMDGPVVAATKAAIEQKDVTPILKWVTKENEAEVRRAFVKTQTVRTQSPEARHLADQYLFETVVRLHRAGEGEPYTGLKPAGTEVEPAIAGADEALKTGSTDKVVKLVTDQAAAGIRERFARVREKQKRAEENVEAGREYVAAYVDYVHYVEALHRSAGAQSEDRVNAPGREEHSTQNHPQEIKK
jgi:hypothetical protein